MDDWTLSTIDIRTAAMRSRAKRGVQPFACNGPWPGAHCYCARCESALRVIRARLVSMRISAEVGL